MATKWWLRDIAPSEPKPGAHQTGDTITHYWQTDGTVKLMNETQGSSTVVISYSDTSAAAHYDYIGQWISPALAAGTVPANNWTIQWTASEDNAKADLYIRYYVYLWLANDTKGSDIQAPTSFGTEVNNTDNRQTVTTAFGSTANVSGGDRVVVEFLGDVRNTKATAYTLTFKYSAPNGTFGDSWLNSSITLPYHSLSDGFTFAFGDADAYVFTTAISTAPPVVAVPGGFMDTNVKFWGY